MITEDFNVYRIRLAYLVWGVYLPDLKDFYLPNFNVSETLKRSSYK